MMLWLGPWIVPVPRRDIVDIAKAQDLSDDLTNTLKRPEVIFGLVVVHAVLLYLLI